MTALALALALVLALALALALVLALAFARPRQATSKTSMQRGFLDEMAVLRRFLDRYPEAELSITHGFPWRTFLSDDGRKVSSKALTFCCAVTVFLSKTVPFHVVPLRQGFDALPADIWAPFETGRCAVEVSFPVRVGDVFGAAALRQQQRNHNERQ
eukprot:SAG22_NODE_59_length_23617_cov_252.868144_6_plen_157_part_00